MRHLLFLLPLALMLTACQEDIVVEVDSTSQLMVDGLVTNQAGPHYVKLSLTTTDFATDDAFVPARNAHVFITDSLDQTEVLTEASSQPGVYQTKNLRGIVGGTYHLFIRYQDKEYQAQSTLLPVSDKFRLSVKFHEDFGSLETGYYVYYTHRDPNDTVAYYRYFVYENSKLLSGRESIWVSPTYPTKENVSAGKRINYPFKWNDTVKVEIYPLHDEMFKFYTRLERFVDYELDIFSPPPLFPVGNISNGGLGVFRASAVLSKEVTIE